MGETWNLRCASVDGWFCSFIHTPEFSSPSEQMSEQVVTAHEKGRDPNSWVWKGQAEPGCHQVNRQSCANEDGEGSWPSSILGQWKHSLIRLLRWWVNISIPCFKPTEWTVRMNPDANYGVWALIRDCRLTCRDPATAADTDNGEGYVHIGQGLFIWKYLSHQIIPT